MGCLLQFSEAAQAISAHFVIGQLCSLRGIKAEGMNLSRLGARTVCVIGDGYGFLTSLLRIFDPGISVISVNLGRGLFFDVNQMKCVLPGEKAVLLDADGEVSVPPAQGTTYFLEAENYHLLRGLRVDLFFNIASMQEMTKEVIATYFSLMRSSSASPTYFYCCNREIKTLPGGEETRFLDYPWDDAEILADGPCPWYGSQPVAYPPFVQRFAGPLRHRFVRLR